MLVAASAEDIISCDIHPAAKIIASGAFENCVNLAAVSFPKLCQLEVIENSAFESCESLINVNLPKKLKKVGVNAFYGCNKLGNVEFADAENWYMISEYSHKITDFSDSKNTATILKNGYGYDHSYSNYRYYYHVDDQ